MKTTACSRCDAPLTGSPSDSSGLCEKCALEISPTLEASPPEGVPVTQADSAPAHAGGGLQAPSGFALEESRDTMPAAAPRTLAQGDTVGAFTITGELGRGGMAVVYRAKQSGLDRDVALKVLSEGPTTSRERVERFLREARAAASLNHPNIVRVHEVGEDAGVRFLAMELIEGASLDHAVHSETLDWRTAATIVRDAARALHYAHGEGVVHRDMKPGNILLGPDGVARVTDFGLARVEGGGALTADGTAIGTPAYMSPEQAAGDQARVGPRTDVYALGAVLYECLTGRPPAIGESVLEVLHAVQSEDPPPVTRLAPGVPVDLATVTEHALRKELEDRYPDAGALADELDRVLDGQPVHARPIGAVSRILRRVRRHPAGSLAVAAGVIGLLVGAVALATLADERRAAEQASEARAAARKAAQPYFDKAVDAVAMARTARSRGDGTIAQRAQAEARVAIDRVLAEVPDWAHAWLVDGQVRLLARDHGGARASLDRALRLNPNLADAYYERARMGFDRVFTLNSTAGIRDVEAARPLQTDLAQLARLERRPARGRVAQAMSALLDSDYASAELAIEAALTEDPYLADAYALRAHVHLGQGTSLSLRGKRREARARFLKAATDFDRAISMGVDPDLILAGRVQARSAVGRAKDALADANHFIALDPNDAVRWFLRARLRQQMGDDDGAEQDLARARELGGDTPETHLQTATVLMANVDRRLQREGFEEVSEEIWKAKAELDWVVQNAPKHGVARFYRAMVHRWTGDLDACQADLQVYLSLAGTNAEYQAIAKRMIEEAGTTASRLARAEHYLPFKQLIAVRTQAAQAHALIEDGKIHEAADIYLKMLQALDSLDAGMSVQIEVGDAGAEPARRKRGAVVRRVEAGGKAQGREAKAREQQEQRWAGEPSEAHEELADKLRAIPAEVRQALEKARREVAARSKWRFGAEMYRGTRQIAHYNVACSFARKSAEAGLATPAGRDLHSQALTHLENAVAAGWGDWKYIENDGDLASLRSDPRYRTLIAAAKSRAAEFSKQQRAERSRKKAWEKAIKKRNAEQKQKAEQEQKAEQKHKASASGS